MLIIMAEIPAGTSIQIAAEDLCSFADATKCIVKAKFNGRVLIASPGSRARDIVNVYCDQFAAKGM